MTKHKPTNTYPGEEVFVSVGMDEHERDHGYYSEENKKTLRELWSGMTKAKRCKWLARHEAYRILREFPDIPKHSVNEPSDCLAAKVQHFLEKRYGEKYSKQHIAERFLNNLLRPQK